MALLIIQLTFTFFLSLCSINLVKKIAYSKNYTNNQLEARWNKSAIALYGGVGFIPVFLVASFYILWLQFDGDYSPIFLIEKNNENAILFGILSGTLLMFVVGIIDDVISLGARIKLLFQTIGASIFLVFADVIFIHNHPLLNILVTYLWFVGIINAFNLLDNMDGLATGVVIVSLIGSIYFIVNSSLGFNSLSCLIILLLIASLGAFLSFNFPPATIFMGDSGSLSLGFLVAAFAAPSPLNDYFLPLNTNSYPIFIGTLVSFSIAVVPIFDTAFVTITRLWESRKISQGGKDHTSHRLMYSGLNDRKVVTFFYFFALTGFSIAILISKYPTFWLPLFVFLLLFMSMLGVYVGRIKIPKKTPQTFLNFPFNKQFAELLMDIGLITLCLYIAFILRFGVSPSEIQVSNLNSILPIIIGSTLISFVFFGVYNKKLVHLNFEDLILFLKVSIGAVILSIAMVTMFLQFPGGNSRSVYLIFGALLFPTTFFARFSFKILDKIITGKN